MEAFTFHGPDAMRDLRQVVHGQRLLAFFGFRPPGVVPMCAMTLDSSKRNVGPSFRWGSVSFLTFLYIVMGASFNILASCLTVSNGCIWRHLLGCKQNKTGWDNSHNANHPSPLVFRNRLRRSGTLGVTGCLLFSFISCMLLRVFEINGRLWGGGESVWISRLLFRRGQWSCPLTGSKRLNRTVERLVIDQLPTRTIRFCHTPCHQPIGAFEHKSQTRPIILSVPMPVQPGHSWLLTFPDQLGERHAMTS